MYSCNLNDIIIYINKLKKQLAPKTLRSYVIDIRRLLRLIDPKTADLIQPPKLPKRRETVNKKSHIKSLISQARSLSESKYLRLRAAILIAATSGLRAFELYSLTLDDINISSRTIYLSATKTKDYEDRITFFSEEARGALIDFLDKVSLKTSHLFPLCTIEKDFKRLDVECNRKKLRMKHMRKFFSQQSDCLGMPTAVKKILMGHSLRGDVDLGYYDFQDEEELKKFTINIGKILGRIRNWLLFIITLFLSIYGYVCVIPMK